jgi:hypothetical protein
LAKLFDSTLAAPAASIDTGANGIAGTYDVLQIWVIARTAEAAALSTLVCTFNNDGGANYDYTLVRNRNTTVAGVTALGDTSFGVAVMGGSAAASYATVIRMSVPGYAQTTFFKALELTTATETSAAANGDVGTWAVDYRSTTAISRMKIAVSGGSNLATGSRLLIYGV